MKRVLAGFIFILIFIGFSVSVFSISYTITFIPPTLNNTIITVNYSYINVSLNGTTNLDAVILEWNGTANETMSGAENVYFLNKTFLSNGNYTFRVWANDTGGNYSVSEDAWVYINYTPPAAPDNPPTVTLNSPSDDSIDTDGTVTFNCSATDDNQLTNITLYHNISRTWSINETKNLTGISDSETWTINNILNGTSFVWNCLAYDNASNSSWASSNRTVNIMIAGDTTPPTIAYTITPTLIQNGSGVLIGINATDNVNISAVWAQVTRPGGSTENISLVNNGMANYTSTSLPGSYTVRFYANDTSGNGANAIGYFYSGEQVQFSANVVGYNQNGIDSDLIIYYSGTTSSAGSYSNSTGQFRNRNIISYVYDFLFSAYSDNLQVLLRGVNVSLNLNRILGLDMLSTPVSGYISTYAVDNTYAISSARVRISYNPAGLNESSLVVYTCSNWNFTGRSCAGSWSGVTATQNTAGNYFDIEVSGFSAFSISEEGYCGDGVCSTDETPASCPADCQCTAGQTRPCSDNYQGVCAVGSESCITGSWTGCSSPGTETCNTYDDDCDGVVDNVGGGASVDTTQCQCYNGGLPVVEVCNNIDDDCNGLIDDGVTRPCGNDTGKCRVGTRSCVNGQWSTICLGEIRPDTNETCANNIDDDCDGETDEGCASSLPCGYGLIPETGCKCGDLTYVAGYCCNGVYQADEPCPVFPWWIFLVGGIAILVFSLVYDKLRKGKKKTTWEALEKKYTPAKMQAGIGF